MLDIMSEISIENKDLFNEARLKELMKEEGLAAVVGFSPANVRYMSGYYNIDMHLLPEIMHAVIWPLEGEPTFMVYENNNPFRTFISDVRRFPAYSEIDTALWSLVDILKEKGLSGEKIGLEKRYVSAYNWEVINNELPEVYWVDGTDVMERTRFIKTPKEVDLLRAAVRATDKSIFLAYAGARPTDTEKSVGDAMSHNVMRNGADIVAFNIIASGRRTTQGHFLGEDTQLEKGTIMRCDFGANFSGYFTDLARMAVIGKPSQRQQDTYKKFLEVQQRSLQAARPGVTGEELYDRSIQAHYDLGLGWRTMVGHSIGVTVHERPIAAPGEPWEFQEGMVLCIENGSTEQDYGERYHIEDTILVIKDGYEMLSDYTNTESMTVIE